MSPELIKGVLFALAGVALVLTLVGLAMGRRMLWRTALVALTCVFSVALLYPLDQTLKPGLDLAGGTVLVYEVEVPEGSDTRTAIEQTIQVLRERVDPLEQKSLVWRRVGASRLEIQMPAPSRAAKERRQAFAARREALFRDNLQRSDLNGLLRLQGPAREQGLASLAKDQPQRRVLLAQLLAAQDALTAAQGPYETAQKAKDATDAALAKATGDAKDALQKKLDAQIAALEPLALALYHARQQVEQAQKAVLDTNIDPAELDRILALPTTATEAAVEAATATQPATANPRQAALDKFIAAHPQQADALRQVADAYAAYEKFKGTLDDPNDLIALLRGSGVLEFRIAPAPDAVPDVEQYRQQLLSKGPRAALDKPYRWFAIDKPENFAEGANHAETQRNLQLMRAHPADYFAAQRRLIAEVYGGDYYLLLANGPDDSLTKAQPDWEMRSVTRSTDPSSGFPCVSFRLNTIGGAYMGRLTGSHIDQPMAIVLDDRVLNAPTVRSKINDSGQISGGSGGFSDRELDYLIRTLSAGSLQARLSDSPILIQQIGGSFGADNLQSGLSAAYWSLGVVCVFMIVYYFFWGCVANFALLANLLLVLGAMAGLHATITLPGIAGLILTIGMAVDANVLIYERIREELERHADLHTAVRQGFDRAFSSIFDSNITTLLTCIILGYTATADLKGFAVTLGIGVAINLFTGVFGTHMVIDLYMTIFKPRRLPMLPIVIPALRRLLTPNIDWVRHKWKFISVSLVVIVIGIVAVVQRGVDFLDIEFRGGTQVSFKLDEGKTLAVAQVRQRLNQVAKETDTPLIKGDDCVIVTVGPTQGDQATGFSVATLLQDPKLVSARIKAAFHDVVSSPEPISFAGMGDPNGDAPSVRGAPVFAVRNNSLGRVIGKGEYAAATAPEFDVSDYLGGVAVVVSDMHPAATAADVTARLQRMQAQPNYEKLGYRPMHVIGLVSTGADDPRSGQPLYTSVAVMAKDNSTNYMDNPDAFADEGGLAQTQWTLVRDALLRDTSLGSITNFSSQVSATMQQQAVTATVLSWIAILVYVWVRFGNLRYGLGAVIALIHDVFMAVGLAAAATYLVNTSIGRALLLEPFHLNLSMVAAVLTLIGYSVNDTIVTFDRIRENRGRLSWATPQIINDSINQTLSRSLLTVSTVFFSVVILYFVGGAGVHTFAFVMLVGTIVGCYSSIAIASPILLIGTWGRMAQEQAAAAGDKALMNSRGA